MSKSMCQDKFSSPIIDAGKSRAQARLDILLEKDGRPMAIMELKRPILHGWRDGADHFWCGAWIKVTSGILKSLPRTTYTPL